MLSIFYILLIFLARVATFFLFKNLRKKSFQIGTEGYIPSHLNGQFRLKFQFLYGSLWEAAKKKSSSTSGPATKGGGLGH